MRFGKSFWLIGPLIILAASLLLYYEHYRDHTGLFFLCLIFSFLGWVIIYWFLIKKSLPYKNTLAKIRSETWLGRLDVFITACLCALTMSYTISIAEWREAKIWEHSPTKITNAIVNETQTGNNRYGSVNYYAYFKYVVGTKTIVRRLRHNGYQYLWGQRYEIKYVVEYPEMFKVVKLLP
jgi:hypothetical protein